MEWSLASNSGEVVAAWSAVKEPDGRLSCDFRLSVTRDGGHRTQSDDAEAAVEVHLRGLVANQSLVGSLAERLVSWLELPLAEFRRSPLAVEAALGSRGWDEFVRLSLASSEPGSGQHAVATLEYEVCGVRGGVSFEVDQSCIRVFAEGMRDAAQGANT